VLFTALNTCVSVCAVDLEGVFNKEIMELLLLLPLL
jgi:hypothetical protein